jgi:LAO/AO transport system kinase
VVGITGNPGSGKSTLVDGMIRELRARGRRVGVVAIDPSSPFNGGAILGDRIRMQHHSEDPGVFIRSLATRGHLGGLTRSTSDVVTILDAMGYEMILIETVGVGQDEVDIVRTAHTSVVVLVPGLGDDIQVMKAGILEIADLFVVNKADRPGAERVVAELETVQALVASPAAGWHVPILKAVATQGQGVRETVDGVAAHAAYLHASGGMEQREQARLMEMMHSVLWESAQARFATAYAQFDARLNLTGRLLARQVSPYEVARTILSDAFPADGEEGK